MQPFAAIYSCHQHMQQGHAACICNHPPNRSPSQSLPEVHAWNMDARVAPCTWHRFTSCTCKGAAMPISKKPSYTINCVAGMPSSSQWNGSKKRGLAKRVKTTVLSYLSTAISTVKICA
jgi:hypothetical protein